MVAGQTRLTKVGLSPYAQVRQLVELKNIPGATIVVGRKALLELLSFKINF